MHGTLPALPTAALASASPNGGRPFLRWLARAVCAAIGLTLGLALGLIGALASGLIGIC